MEPIDLDYTAFTIIYASKVVRNCKLGMTMLEEWLKWWKETTKSDWIIAITAVDDSATV